jgi:hypothetical protein
LIFTTVLKKTGIFATPGTPQKKLAVRPGSELIIEKGAFTIESRSATHLTAMFA